MKSNVLSLLWVLSVTVTFAKVKLPALVSDGMVLQREQRVKIWGWADAGEHVVVTFKNQTYRTVAPVDGEWSLTLPKMKAGGPYTMTVTGENKIIIADILIGDVWLCSGQSNMAFKMDRVKERYADAVATSSNRNIRQFLVQPSWSFSLHRDVESEGWKQADPQTILDFTAVGYFFVRAIFEETQVPIGVINASYSATVAEAWISEEGLSNFPKYVADANKYKAPDEVRKVLHADSTLKANWNRRAQEEDIGLSPDGNNWTDFSFDISNWDTVDVPGYWSKATIKNLSGVVWMVKDIDIPTQLAGRDATLFFGAIDDRDNTYFNGVNVGHSYMRGRARRYDVPGELIREGRNRIIVRVVNPDGPGGFYPDKQCEFISGNSHINLAGSWKYRVGVTLPALRSNMITKFNTKPTAVFNSMIHPLTNYAIKGVAWYQGEGNTGRASEYRQLFTDLILDWRKKWGQGDFPFLYVQLPNYGKVLDRPANSSWAELREAQSMALDLPNTGMAVIHDVGETNDIHPREKKTVGDRLALAALKIAYYKHVVSSGPVYDAMRVERDKVIITFKHIGLGLTARNSGELKCFEIAGKDQKFVWAKARIENDSVVVWSDEVKQPVAVRYAWANNPLEANLYNKNGLPAASFRTDNRKSGMYKKQ